jgi:hypothetical protein
MKIAMLRGEAVAETIVHHLMLRNDKKWRRVLLGKFKELLCRLAVLGLA